MRSSFYYVAVAAGVPIALGSFDFPRKRVNVNAFFTPSGNVESISPQSTRFYRDLGNLGAKPTRRRALGVSQVGERTGVLTRTHTSPSSPSSWILRVSVLRPQPSHSLASMRRPFVCSNAGQIIVASNSRVRRSPGAFSPCCIAPANVAASAFFQSPLGLGHQVNMQRVRIGRRRSVRGGC